MLLGLEISQVLLAGGRSPLWRQILADAFNTEIVTVNITEGAAYGAALLAGVGAGVYSSVEQACDAAIRITGSNPPGEAAKVYASYYPRYRALYPALKAEFAALSNVK
jgi:xylulokinase